MGSRIADENELLAQVATRLPVAQRVLVFAPHPDDEVFGCGGIAALLRTNGAAVSVIIVTDGAAGGDNAAGTLPRLRAAESQAAAAVLGLPEPTFWGLPDRSLAYGELLIERLKAAIATADADLVLLPSPIELHPDHQALALAGIEALRRLGGDRQIALYEINTPLQNPDLLVDISDIAETKLAAMRCFTSQLAQQPYDLRIEGLNRFRSYFLGAQVTAAEAFLLIRTTDLVARRTAWLAGGPLHWRRFSFGVGQEPLPLVSVIIRSMDRPTLNDALHAIALQIYPHIEVIVVNAKGGEHQQLPELCGPFPIRLIHQGGVALRRPVAANLGMQNTRGSYLIFLDDDDLMEPDHLERLVHGVLDQPGREVAYTGVRVVNETGTVVRQLNEPYDRIRLWQANYLPIHAVLFARSLYERGCRFDESLDVYEDWDFWVQLAGQTDFCQVTGVSATYRLIGTSGISADDNVEQTRHARASFYAKWQGSIPAEELAEALAHAEEARVFAQTLQQTEATLQQQQQGYQALESQYHLLEREHQTQHAAFSDLEHAYRGLEHAYGQILASRSWRMTRPLRSVRPRLRALLRSLYYALPVSDETRLRWRYRLRQILPMPVSSSPDGAVVAPELLDKETVRTRAEAELTDFLTSAERVQLPEVAQPRISVVLVLFNQAGLTLTCLKALAGEQGTPFETIIVDNGSSDRTTELLHRLDGATVIRNVENEGFLLAVNRAAAAARGEFILLLNNDAIVQPGALAAAARRMDSTPDAGAVGGSIRLWDGRLQEAGSIIWRDGSCLGYGRGDDPLAPAYNYVRDVDYCSGAFLLIRRALFEELGRFDRDYAPAYYEESDLCVRLWEHGHRVIYDPAVRIRHFEFASAGERSEQAIALQIRNRERFVSKHQTFLSRQQPATPATLLLARQRLLSGKQRILFIDDRAPQRELGAGFPRAQEFVRALVAEGHFVTHYPLQFPHDPREKAQAALPEQVEFIHGSGVPGLSRFLEERRHYYDSIIVSRPHNMIAINGVYARHPEWFEGVRLIYDAEALFSLRDIARAAVIGQPMTPAEQEKKIRDELAIARHARRIVTVSEAEAACYRRHLAAEVSILGHTQNVYRDRPGFDTRRGYLFVGSIGTADTPNGDSLIWFLRDIWPRITARGEAQLHVVGLCDSAEIRQLATTGVYLHGQVASVEPYYDAARVFIVPTRFAAGIPHKAHEAAAWGVPMVVTPLIAGQLGWDAEVETAGSSEAFAAACSALHDDPDRWQARRMAAWKAVERDCSPAAFQTTVSQIAVA